MVATRNHPREFPDPEPSPRRRAVGSTTQDSSSTPTKALGTRRRTKGNGKWSHTPSDLTLAWLWISIPLIVWDAGYVMLRPHSMPGGFLHQPLWVPYGLYGTVDHWYGLKAWDAGTGWTQAQTTLNVLETIAYAVYLYIVYYHGQPEPTRHGAGAPAPETLGQFGGLAGRRTVVGTCAVSSVLIGYTAAIVTFWKTVLYWLIEIFSGFDAIGHNSPTRLFFLWIVPNGLWLIFPAYMSYIFGTEILQALEVAANGSGNGQGE